MPYLRAKAQDYYEALGGGVDAEILNQSALARRAATEQVCIIYRLYHSPSHSQAKQRLLQRVRSEYSSDCTRMRLSRTNFGSRVGTWPTCLTGRRIIAHGLRGCASTSDAQVQSWCVPLLSSSPFILTAHSSCRSQRRYPNSRHWPGSTSW